MKYACILLHLLLIQTAFAQPSELTAVPEAIRELIGGIDVSQEGAPNVNVPAASTMRCDRFGKPCDPPVQLAAPAVAKAVSFRDTEVSAAEPFTPETLLQRIIIASSPSRLVGPFAWAHIAPLKANGTQQLNTTELRKNDEVCTIGRADFVLLNNLPDNGDNSTCTFCQLVEGRLPFAVSVVDTRTGKRAQKSVALTPRIERSLPGKPLILDLASVSINSFNPTLSSSSDIGIASIDLAPIALVATDTGTTNDASNVIIAQAQNGAISTSVLPTSFAKPYSGSVPPSEQVDDAFLLPKSLQQVCDDVYDSLLVRDAHPAKQNRGS